METDGVVEIEKKKKRIRLVDKNDDNYVFLRSLLIRNSSLRCRKF